MPEAERHTNANRFARFEDAQSQYGRLRAGADALRHDLAALEVSAQSPDGSVSVVVGPRGNVLQLTIADHADLAPAILDTIRRAETLVLQAVQDRIRANLPSGDLHELLQRHDARIGGENAA